MIQLTSEDIWYISLGFGALLTMIPAGLLLSSTFTRKKDPDIQEDKKYLMSFFLLLLAFSFEFSAVYMVLAETSNPIKGLPIIFFVSFAISIAITVSMYLVRRASK